MAGLLNIISKLFGNKYDKDVKEITPIIEKINFEFSKLSALTNDDLREKTSDFKNQITTLTINISSLVAYMLVVPFAFKRKFQLWASRNLALGICKGYVVGIML